MEGVNVASLLTCDEQMANTPCSHVTSMNGEHVPFFTPRVGRALQIGSWAKLSVKENADTEPDMKDGEEKGERYFLLICSIYMIFRDVV